MEARRLAYEAGLNSFKQRITSDATLWPHIQFVGADIRFEHTDKDRNGRWHAWVLVSYPREQFALALERAREREKDVTRRIPIFVAPLAFGRESKEQFPEVVERYRKQGYGNAIWQTVENRLYDHGFEVVTSPISQTRDMLSDILGQFSAESPAAVKLPENLLLLNMNFFEIQTETMSRGRVIQQKEFHVSLMLEMYEVSGDYGNVKIPAKGEARDEDLLAATGRAALRAVDVLFERVKNR